MTRFGQGNSEIGIPSAELWELCAELCSETSSFHVSFVEEAPQGDVALSLEFCHLIFRKRDIGNLPGSKSSLAQSNESATKYQNSSIQ